MIPFGTLHFAATIVAPIHRFPSERGSGFLGVHPRAALHPGNVHSRPPPNLPIHIATSDVVLLHVAAQKGGLLIALTLVRLEQVRHVIVWHTAISAIPGDVG